VIFEQASITIDMGKFIASSIRCSV